jgi:hypothetical protein
MIWYSPPKPSNRSIQSVISRSMSAVVGAQATSGNPHAWSGVVGDPPAGTSPWAT